MRSNNHRQVIDHQTVEEHAAKWAEANRKVAQRNNPASRRKATMDCTIMGEDYLKGDMMPMKHFRIMKTMQLVME